MGLILVFFLAQVPSPGPSMEPLPTPAPANEPAELTGFAHFVDEHLLSLETNALSGFTVRQAGRLLPVDESLAEALSLVPEARALMESAHHAAMVGLVFTLSGLGLDLLGVGFLVPALVGGSLLFIVGAGVAVVAGLVVTLIAVPFMRRSSDQFFEAISLYNHGLTKLRPLPAPPAPQVEREAPTPGLPVAVF